MAPNPIILRYHFGNFVYIRVKPKSLSFPYSKRKTTSAINIKAGRHVHGRPVGMHSLSDQKVKGWVRPVLWPWS